MCVCVCVRVADSLQAMCVSMLSCVSWLLHILLSARVKTLQVSVAVYRCVDCNPLCLAVQGEFE